MDVRVDPAVAREVAAGYRDTPTERSPLVDAAYRQLTVETDRLYAACTSSQRPHTIRVRFSGCACPYDTADELIASVRVDRLLEITGASFDRDRRHPLFDGALGGAFDRFRAVHDILGHALLAAGFDRDGEYAAWRFQERFHSPLARRALATELHAKHSACWTSGEAPEHRTVLVDPRLLERSRSSAPRDDWGLSRKRPALVNPDAPLSGR